MTPSKLEKIKKDLENLKLNPKGIKSEVLIKIAIQLGRKKHPRGKEPTYVRDKEPELSPPLSIPNHKGTALKTGTAKSIINQLLEDVEAWEEENIK